MTSAQRSTGATSLTPGRATTRRTGASEASPSWACAQSGSRSTPAWNSRRSAGRIEGRGTGVSRSTRITSWVRSLAISSPRIRSR
ncbi:hypothetical protein XF14_09820 [Burkholderia gladioli]|nr:hypothetical protein XF14_09820 [Burkholderia gladioli]